MKLLERDDLLQALAGARARAAGGAGGIALVSGEAGIGKTSLVARFTDAIGTDAGVDYGRCDSLFTPRVLGPAHDIAARRGGALAERLESGASRAAIFAAFLADLRRAAPGSVVVFEDVHWADEATLDLIKYLGRRIGETRTLLVLTYRDDELSARHPLRLVLGDLPRDRCTRLMLAPLSPRAVAQLAHEAGGGGDAASLHAATGGNPFFVTEALAGGSGGVPASVRDAVLARAARLSPAARAAAELVSVEPGGMEPWLAEACLGSATEALAECEERGILRSQGGMLRFRHEIARLAVHGALTTQRARTLHRTVLEALRAKGAGAEMLARLAHHAEAADEGDSVVRYAIAAARRASSLAAHREAADHYSRAARFAASLPERERAELLDAYAWECHLTGRFDAGQAAREAAIAAWRKLGERGQEAQSLSRLAHLLVLQGRYAESERAIHEALVLIESMPPGPAPLLVLRQHAYLRMLDRDVAEAIEAGHKALDLAQRLGDDEAIIQIGNTIGSSMLVDDDPRGVDYLERSLAAARERDLDYHVANALGNLGSASGEVNRFTAAAGYLEQAMVFARHHDLENALNYEGAWLALVRLHQGRWSEAAEGAQEVLRHPAAHTIARIMALLAMGRLRARRGDPGAWDALDEALALSEGTETLQRLAPVRAARAEAAWLAGEDAAAAREASAGWELALRKKHGWFTGELGYWQWKGGRSIDLPPFAAKPYALQVGGRWHEAAEEWRARGCPYETARALAEGDNDARLEALRIFVELGARPAAERVRQSLRDAGVRRIPRGPRPSTRAHPSGLTAREVQILGLVAEGLTNAEIGARLHISPKTVDHHVSAVLAKLGASSRRAAVKAAAALGLEL